MNKQHCIIAFNDQNKITVAVYVQGQVSQVETFNDEKDLATFFKQQKLFSVSATALLAPKDYQLFQTKKPDVSDKELKQALIWQEQKRFNLPVDTLYIEHFDAPNLLNQHKPSTYLFGISKKTLKERYQTLYRAGCDIDAIIIPELYLSKVAMQISGNDPVAIVMAYPDNMQVFFYQSGAFAMSSRLPEYDNDAAKLSAQLRESVDRISARMGDKVRTDIMWVAAGKLTESQMSECGMKRHKLLAAPKACEHTEQYLNHLVAMTGECV